MARRKKSGYTPEKFRILSRTLSFMKLELEGDYLKMMFAGSAALLLIFLSIPYWFADILRYYITNDPIYTSMYVFSTIAMIFLIIIEMIGFITLSARTSYHHLGKGAEMMILVALFSGIYRMMIVFMPKLDVIFTSLLFLITAGIAQIWIGWGLYEIQRTFSHSAKYAGILNLIIGGLFCSVIFSYFSVLFLVPAKIFEMIVLFRAAKRYKVL